MPAGRLQRAGQTSKPKRSTRGTSVRGTGTVVASTDVASTGLAVSGGSASAGSVPAGVVSDVVSTGLASAVGIGGRLTVPGRTGKPIDLSLDVLTRLLGPAMIVAAGLDPAITKLPPRPVLWSDGANRLLVHLDGAELRCGDGFTDVVIGVQCDETKRASVCSTFVTSSPDKPGGFVWATEHRPRGPEVVVTVWGDALVALAWRALVEITRVVCTALGHDAFGRPLVPATVVATTDGWRLTPMAPHRTTSLGSRG